MAAKKSTVQTGSYDVKSIAGNLAVVYALKVEAGKLSTDALKNATKAGDTAKTVLFDSLLSMRAHYIGGMDKTNATSQANARKGYSKDCEFLLGDGAKAPGSLRKVLEDKGQAASTIKAFLSHCRKIAAKIWDTPGFISDNNGYLGFNALVKALGAPKAKETKVGQTHDKTEESEDDENAVQPAPITAAAFMLSCGGFAAAMLALRDEMAKDHAYIKAHGAAVNMLTAVSAIA